MLENITFLYSFLPFSWCPFFYFLIKPKFPLLKKVISPFFCATSHLPKAGLPSPTQVVLMYKSSSRWTKMINDNLPAKGRASWPWSSLSFCPSAHSFGNWPKRVQVLSVFSSRTWQVWQQRSLGKADSVSLQRSPMALQVPASQRTHSLGITSTDLFVIWGKECVETQRVWSLPFLPSHFLL